MTNLKLKTSEKIKPMVYAFTTTDIPHLKGYVKIGSVFKQTVKERIRSEVHTMGITNYKIEWYSNAIFDNDEEGSEVFKDIDFHKYLRGMGIESYGTTEWFKISPDGARKLFDDFRRNKGILHGVNYCASYTLRKEQLDAVEMALAYKKAFEEGKVKTSEFLWNAKPRFGKTLAAYELCKKINAKNILIITNKPSIADSWYNDYEKFLGQESGYYFVSEVDVLKDRKLCLSRNEYTDIIFHKQDEENIGCIEFVSLPNLKRSKHFGGFEEKLSEVASINWDIFIVDECHDGVETGISYNAFKGVNRKFTLHMSGTAFKAIANDKFPPDAIYSWTYVDEQMAKERYEKEGKLENPYDVLPRLNLITYPMAEIIKNNCDYSNVLSKSLDFAFDLNEFFAIKENSENFKHKREIETFLNVISSKEVFPFATEESRNQIKHTLWLLNRVDSVYALKNMLENHPIFSEYKIVIAAGNGKADDDDDWVASKKSLDKVRKAIKEYDKTITLSVGQLTTGVTIPEWTAVMILSNINSCEKYMQAAFRTQNPWVIYENGEVYRKYNSYIIDFDTIRSLNNFEAFANDLIPEIRNKNNDLNVRISNVNSMLRYFSVYSSNDEGEIVELTAKNILSLPRKIRSKEVVESRFISNFLFNSKYISNLFSCPMEVVGIINKIQDEPKGRNTVTVDKEIKEKLGIDDKGNINVSEKKIEEISENIFSDFEDKAIENFSEISDTISNDLKSVIDGTFIECDNKDINGLKLSDKVKKDITDTIVKPIIQQVKSKCGEDLTPSIEKEISKKTLETVSGILDNGCNEMTQKCQENVTDNSDMEDVEIKNKQVMEDMFKDLKNNITELSKQIKKDVVTKVEIRRREEEKKKAEEKVRKKLRGFARSIPAFVFSYGYGVDIVTLKNLDSLVPAREFYNITGITVDEFRLLRDGGYIEGETKNDRVYFEGNVFDEVVFNDSCMLFLEKAYELANYYDITCAEDIFDYMAPQRDNLIFIPRNVALKCLKHLEDENPGCFDNPNFVFIDPHVKSGLFLAEIVKRLNKSKVLNKVFPNENERIKHIFEKQIYGLAPNETLYRMATNYLVGFDASIGEIKHNIRIFDFSSLPQGLSEDEVNKRISALFE